MGWWVIQADLYSHLGKQTWPEGLYGDPSSLDQGVQLVLLKDKENSQLLATTDHFSFELKEYSALFKNRRLQIGDNLK